MMKHLKPDGRLRGRWLVLLGACLLIFALVMVYRAPTVAQYMVSAPIEQPGGAEGDGEDAQANAESALMGVVKAWDAQKVELGAGAKAGIAAAAYDSAMTSSTGQTDMATLFCVSAGWFDAHPKYLKAGRLPGEPEQTDGGRVIVLDEQLAFKLFPTTEPTDGKVQIGESWYQVIGVVRHRRQAGDSDAYGAYIPIVAAAKAGMQTDFLQLDCVLDIPGAARAVESVGTSVLGAGGSFYDIEKEAMRASMIVRVLIVLFALYALGRLLRAWNARTRDLVSGWREEVMHRYFKKMLPAVIGWSLLQLLGYAALIAAAYGVLRLTIGPMYVFTEWIPEVVVEWSKIEARARALLTAAAAPIKYQTREFATVRFYGGLVRWGVVCVLCGLLLMRLRGRGARTEETPGALPPDPRQRD